MLQHDASFDEKLTYDQITAADVYEALDEKDEEIKDMTEQVEQLTDEVDRLTRLLEARS